MVGDKQKLRAAADLAEDDPFDVFLIGRHGSNAHKAGRTSLNSSCRSGDAKQPEQSVSANSMVETELQRATELEADSEAPASSVNASSLETAENGKPTPVTAGNVLLAMVLYSIAASGMMIVNKLCMKEARLPTLYSALQFITAALTVYILSLLEQVPQEDVTLRASRVRPYALYSLIFSATIYSNMQALFYSSVATIIVFRAAVPLVVCVLDWSFLGRQLPSKRSCIALLGVAGSAAGYVTYDHEFQLSGLGAYTWVTIYFITISIEMAYAKHIVGPQLGFQSIWGPVYHTNFISTGTAIALMLITSEEFEVVKHAYTWRLVCYIVLSCFVSVAISYSGWRCRSLVSASCFTVLGVGNKMATVLMSALIWDDDSTWIGMACLFTCVVSACCYQQSPMRGDDSKAMPSLVRMALKDVCVRSKRYGELTEDGTGVDTSQAEDTACGAAHLCPRVSPVIGYLLSTLAGTLLIVGFVGQSMIPQVNPSSILLPAAPAAPLPSNLPSVESLVLNPPSSPKSPWPAPPPLMLLLPERPLPVPPPVPPSPRPPSPIPTPPPRPLPPSPRPPPPPSAKPPPTPLVTLPLKAVRLSSTYEDDDKYPFPATKCVDHDLNSFCHSKEGEEYPWLSAALYVESAVEYIQIENRRDCCRERLGKFEIWVGQSAGAHALPAVKCGEKIAAEDASSILVACGVTGRFVTIVLTGEERTLNLAEMSVLAPATPPPTASPPPPPRRFAPLPAYIDGTGPEEQARVRDDLLTVQCSGPVDEYDLLEVCMAEQFGACGGFGAVLNRFLWRGHNLMLSGISFHNDKFWLRAASFHGQIASTSRCPQQDQSCFWVSTKDRCASLGRSHSESEVRAAAERLKCAHPYVVNGEIHHLLFEPNDWLQTQIDKLSSFAGDGPDIGIHVRRGDRVNVEEETPKEGIRALPNDHIAHLLQRHAGAPEHHGMLRHVVLMSDDVRAGAGIASALDSSPELHVTFLDLGADEGRRCSQANYCTATISTDLGAFLFAGFLLVSRARVLIANSNSNLAVLIDTLSETHSLFPSTPILVDMDLRMTNAALQEGKYFCDPQWGSRHGLCPAGIAEECEPSGAWHASPDTPDDAVIAAPCTPSMRLTCNS